MNFYQGQQIGDRTIVKVLDEYSEGGSQRVRVRCKCGREEERWAKGLEKSRSCSGCRYKGEGRIKIAPGFVYNGWTVVTRWRNERGRYFLRAEHECGNVEEMHSSNLYRKRCKQCAPRNRSEERKAANVECGICGSKGHDANMCGARSLGGVYCMCGKPAVEYFRGQAWCRPCLLDA